MDNNIPKLNLANIYTLQEGEKVFFSGKEYIFSGEIDNITKNVIRLLDNKQHSTFVNLDQLDDSIINNLLEEYTLQTIPQNKTKKELIELIKKFFNYYDIDTEENYIIKEFLFNYIKNLYKIEGKSKEFLKYANEAIELLNKKNIIEIEKILAKKEIKVNDISKFDNYNEELKKYGIFSYDELFKEFTKKKLTIIINKLKGKIKNYNFIYDEDMNIINYNDYINLIDKYNKYIDFLNKKCDLQIDNINY